MPSLHRCGCSSMLVSLALAAAPPLHAQAACPIRFTPLPVLTLTPAESLHVDWPRPVRTATGLYLIGQQVTVWHSTNIDAPSVEFPDSVAGLVAPGPLGPWRLLPAPVAGRRQNPVAFVRGRNLGMIWGAAPGDSTGRTTSELWYAEYDGRGWSRPSAIVTGRAITWTNDAPAAVSQLGDTLLVAVAIAESTEAYVGVFRGAAGRWRESRISTRALSAFPVNYVTILGRPGDIEVAFTTMESMSSVLVLESRDDGQTWSRPRRVSAGSQAAQAHESRLLQLDDSTRVLLWGIKAAGSVFPDSLGVEELSAGRHSTSTVAADGGFSPQHFLVTDARGRLHLVAIEPSGGIVYTRWTVNTRCSARLAGAEHALATPALLPWTGDSLLVWWTEALDPRGYLPVTRTGIISSDPQPGRVR
jgi:hypothetical protein